jgi:cytochrome subunit of sulfide dehydrogenase
MDMKMNPRIPAFLVALALFYGPYMTDAAAADIAALTQPCEDCHGKDGVSQEPTIPTIAGNSSAFIVYALEAFRDKTWPCEEVKYPAGAHKGETSNMCKPMDKLSDDDMELIADYYADKPFVRAKQSFDANLAKTGKGIHALHCEKCHEDGGSSTDDDAGILAGQWMPYLEEQFKQYSSGKRPMPEKMKPKYEELSADDIKALIQYYGSIQ